MSSNTSEELRVAKGPIHENQDLSELGWERLRDRKDVTADKDIMDG